MHYFESGKWDTRVGRAVSAAKAATATLSKNFSQRWKGTAQFWHDKLFEPIMRLLVYLVALGKVAYADGDVGHAFLLFASGLGAVMIGLRKNAAINWWRSFVMSS